MSPGAGVIVLGRGQISHILMKMFYFFMNLFSTGIDQKSIVMMTKEFTKIVVRVLVPRHGNIVKM